MGIKKTFLKQFGKPSGTLGKFVGYLMSVKNKERSNWTVEKINFKPSDYILKIGYGPGTTLKKIASKLTTGFIAGIDHSPVMLTQAIKKNNKNIENNKVDLKCGTVWELKYPEKYFDIIFGSNVHFFWKDTVKEFNRLYSFLKENGRLVMVFQPRYIKSEEQLQKEAEKTKTQFAETGLKNIEVDFKKMKPVSCILHQRTKITF
jgi:ubiquinone/menaquinone biosynthesis C-methylase UbiE